VIAAALNYIQLCLLCVKNTSWAFFAQISHAVPFRFSGCMHVPIPHFNSIWLILLTWSIILS
jgi:hypothetical protein